MHGQIFSSVELLGLFLSLLSSLAVVRSIITCKSRMGIGVSLRLSSRALIPIFLISHFFMCGRSFWARWIAAFRVPGLSSSGRLNGLVISSYTSSAFRISSFEDRLNLRFLILFFLFFMENFTDCFILTMLIQVPSMVVVKPIRMYSMKRTGGNKCS